jgi:acetylornithine/succinyldiaminopimelate/putrescine aminotransferase
MEDPIIQANLSIIKTYQNRGIVIKKGKGVYLYDDKNQKYLDLMSNYGANILGHCHPLLVKNLTYQIKTLTNLHGSFINDIRSKAAYLLKSKIQTCLKESYKLIFSNSGAEAVDNAIKIGLLLSKKQKILYFSKAYHGKTLLSLAVTDSEKYKKGIPTYFGKNLIKVKYNNEKDLEEKFTDEIGVVIVELIQGDGGINEAKKSFIKKIEKLSQKFGAIFIVDEIQTGVGRTGKFFASEYYNIKPDIVLLGKGIAGGIPCSVIFIKEKYQNLIEKGFQTSTFAGNPLSACGIITVLKVLTPSFLDNVEKTGQFFKESLKNYLEKKGYQVRGKGLMIGVETFKNNQTEILKKLQSEKILAIPASTNVIRFLPPLIIDKKTIEKNLKKIVNCF